MEINIEYKPNDKQTVFHQCGAEEVVYGGAKGGGKSCALVMETLAYCLEHAGCRCALFRETYDDLEANIIREWKTKVPRQLYKYSETKHVAVLMNGSEIEFRYCSSDDDADGYQGRSYDYIGVDELTKHSEYAIQILLSCLRSPKGFPTRFRATCNPGGKGHAWVKKRYIDATFKGEKIIQDKVSGNRIAFIPATVYDNVVLMANDPAYVRRLENLPEAQKKAFLYGDWDIFDGQYFTEFVRDIHVIKPFEIPKRWRRYTAMDYGLDMFAQYWIAVDEDNNAYVYREIYESGVIVSDACAKVRETEKETDDTDIYIRLAPPDLWNTQSITGKSTALLFAENGLQLTKSNNDRISGWMAVKELLKIDKGRGKPRLFIFANCYNLIRCIPLAQYDDKKINDVANEPHEITHSLDALRYFANAWTFATEKEVQKKQSVLPFALQTGEDEYYEESGGYIEW